MNIKTKNKPLITIITVCYNSKDTLDKTIESVLNQSYSDIEYIIVDGLSTDGSVDLAKRYEASFQEKGYQYRIISEEDNGMYDAMNKGIKLANGELIGIINSDDWYENQTVEYVANTYLKTNFDYFYADVRLVKQNGTSIIKKSRKDRFPSSRHWNHPTSFIPKRVYNEIGLFKNRGIHDDFDLFLRTRRSQKKIEIHNVVLANFRMGGVSNAKSIKKSVERCKDRYQCYRDNGYSIFSVFECIIMEVAKFLS